MSHSADIAAIRKDYQFAVLDESHTGEDPLFFFKQWFQDAVTAEVNEVNAMTLATCDAHQKPHARIVLLKGLDEKGFVFFTNYNSRKGNDLSANPCAALIFFWPELERQVRIEGMVEKISSADSDAYFHSRPEGSRIGAWASPQSEIIGSREELEKNLEEMKTRFAKETLERPAHWGGYCLIPQYIEFWQGRSDRLHDRIVFEREDEGWKKFRLAS